MSASIKVVTRNFLAYQCIALQSFTILTGAAEIWGTLKRGKSRRARFPGVAVMVALPRTVSAS
jgi:hypothetical protein